MKKKCRKRDLNPHERNAHTDLNRARLPIPPFLHLIYTQPVELCQVSPQTVLRVSAEDGT